MIADQMVPKRIDTTGYDNAASSIDDVIEARITGLLSETIANLRETLDAWRTNSQ